MSFWQDLKELLFGKPVIAAEPHSHEYTYFKGEYGCVWARCSCGETMRGRIEGYCGDRALWVCSITGKSSEIRIERVAWMGGKRV